MADRFYVSFEPTPGRVVLQGPEAHHLATVLRAKPGEVVCLFDGRGAEFPATVVETAKKAVTLDVGPAERPERELPFRLEVAAPLPKGDRGDFLVQKLTELGVTHYVPLRTRRSVSHPRPDRLERSVVEASKQCGRNVLMQVGPVIDLAQYLSEVNEPRVRFVAEFSGEVLCPFGRIQQPVAIIVGPEGGLTADELESTRALGWKAVSLGPRILRVETAATALAAYFALGSV